MRTILAAADFSKTSINAVNYAAELAVQTQSRLLLFHAFQIPVVNSEAAVITIPFDELEEQKNKALKKIVLALYNKYGSKIEVSSLVQAGFIVDAVEELLGSKKIDLVVMGIKGAGKVSEIVIGSSSSDMAGKIKCPVLIIPEKSVFKKSKKIVFATDGEKLSSKSKLKVLLEMAFTFKSKIMLLNVLDKASVAKRSRYKMENNFKDTSHSTHIIENKFDDIVTDINYFVKEKSADMIVMVARKHSLLNRMFNERKTKKMAFHTHIPLLVLNDK